MFRAVESSRAEYYVPRSLTQQQPRRLLVPRGPLILPPEGDGQVSGQEVSTETEAETPFSMDEALRGCCLPPCPTQLGPIGDQAGDLPPGVLGLRRASAATYRPHLALPPRACCFFVPSLGVLYWAQVDHPGDAPGGLGEDPGGGAAVCCAASQPRRPPPFSAPRCPPVAGAAGSRGYWSPRASDISFRNSHLLGEGSGREAATPSISEGLPTT